MEVASPLTFGRVEAGSKRRFACSPIIDATMTVESGAGDDHIMDETYGHVVKRRRRHGSPEFLNTNVMTASPFTAFPSPQVEIVHGKSRNWIIFYSHETQSCLLWLALLIRSIFILTNFSDMSISPIDYHSLKLLPSESVNVTMNTLKKAEIHRANQTRVFCTKLSTSRIRRYNIFAMKRSLLNRQWRA
jgi:hypothetical protein